MHCGMFSNIPGLYPLDASSTTPISILQIFNNQMCPDIAKCSQGEKTAPDGKPLGLQLLLEGRIHPFTVVSIRAPLLYFSGECLKFRSRIHHVSEHCCCNTFDDFYTTCTIIYSVTFLKAIFSLHTDRTILDV